METKHYCNVCKRYFTRNYLLTQHMTSKKHLIRKLNTSPLFECGCGRSYTYKNSLEYHKKGCCFEKENTIENMKQKLEIYEKEREEMKAHITMLLDKHADGSNNITTNNTQNINSQTNNITININAFGNENIDYIDDKAIIQCIEKVYRSIPAMIEKIHFDPKHPENHNIRITNKKMPYASVMGNNQKWETMDRKVAIENMVHKGYYLLDEKYTENKSDVHFNRQSHFEGFQHKFECDDKELIKNLKNDVDIMVLNRSA